MVDTFEPLTQSKVKEKWDWVDSSDAIHIKLYNNDELPEEFLSYLILFEELLKDEKPDFFHLTSDIFKDEFDENIINFGLNQILFKAYLFFIKNPEMIEDFPLLEFYAKRNSLDNYLVEDFLLDMESSLDITSTYF